MYMTIYINTRCHFTFSDKMLTIVMYGHVVVCVLKEITNNSSNSNNKYKTNNKREQSIVGCPVQTTFLVTWTKNKNVTSVRVLMERVK